MKRITLGIDRWRRDRNRGSDASHQDEKASRQW